MVLIVAVTAVACGSTSITEPTPMPTPTPTPTATVPATLVPIPPTETVQDSLLLGLEGWANSEPFTIAKRTAEGDVVLVDFWTYTCVNCIRTFPFLNEWHDKYGESGLTILGVHTPEFEFEKDRAGVLEALDRFGLEYAVAQDNERGTWNAFENRAWPAKYLFGADGELVYTHIGEGDYIDTEREIRNALVAAGHDVSGIAIGTSDGPEEDETAYYLTEELYAGYGKVYGLGGALSIAQVEYYEQSDRIFDYQDFEFHHFNKIYLQGPWLNEKDAIVHARETSALEDYLYAHIFARSANVVVEHRGEEPIDVYVELDGAPVPMGGAGADVVYDDNGASLIRVEESRLYSLLELEGFGEHELVVKSNSDRFAVSSFTFGNYVQGP
ncbi:redoxin family protein [bacterium]|nr:redoxin family protein [bacterium]